MDKQSGHIAQEEFIKLLEQQGHKVIRPSRGAEDAERRIAACLSACKGITTKALEAGGLNNFDLQLDRMLLTQQRDELLAAFEEVLRISDRKHDAWDRARAAIAAAKGEQSPRYTSITKGGSYERLGTIRGAGSLKGLSGIAYRDPATGNLFVREPECFAARMTLIPDPADAVDGVAQ